VRQDVLPAASYARSVTVLIPVRMGILADHAVVPDAAPDRPKLVDHVIVFTPTLSLAVPLTVNVLADVAALAVEGTAMVMVGGVLSTPPPALFVLDRTTVTDFATRELPAIAVIVITLLPSASGMLATVQAAPATLAAPFWPVLLLQETVIAPDPPTAVPARLSVVAGVVAAIGFTVRVKGSGVGVGVGAGTGRGAGGGVFPVGVLPVGVFPVGVSPVGIVPVLAAA
jgi:hypothetical protein